jgi:LmbE family N-acetylglucosaminyl deacetylase
VEARRSLASHGITNVWFLRASDTPTQDVLHSLESVGHGEALEEVIRVVRLTRPEVVLTWLPAYVDGENHGDHQASAVLATEAFDLAGDPTAFPEQVSAPRDHLSISNYGEGLHPWQAKKLFFFSDASDPEFLAHRCPSYLAISRSKGIPFSDLNRIAWNFYATQAEPTEESLHLSRYGFQCRFQPGAQLGVLRPTGYDRPSRHQHLQVGGMQMDAGRQVHFGRRFTLQPFEQPLGILDSHHIAQYSAVPLEFNGHQTISRILRIMSTEPSPIRADPEYAGRPERNPAKGF